MMLTAGRRENYNPRRPKTHTAKTNRTPKILFDYDIGA